MDFSKVRQAILDAANSVDADTRKTIVDQLGKVADTLNKVADNVEYAIVSVDEIADEINDPRESKPQDVKVNVSTNFDEVIRRWSEANQGWMTATEIREHAEAKTKHPSSGAGGTYNNLPSNIASTVEYVLEEIGLPSSISHEERVEIYTENPNIMWQNLFKMAREMKDRHSRE